jgi:methionyl-tRNA formyltransferase
MLNLFQHLIFCKALPAGRRSRNQFGMTGKYMKIIFFGSSNYVIPIIEVLKKSFDLALVITTESPKGNLASQGETLQGCSVIKYCIENKIPYRSVSSLSDSNLKSSIINLKSPVAVLADFGLIIPQEILNAFPKGIINIHPSLLPKYRGPSPVQAAILNGEKITGVSIMKVDGKIDHGPILGFEKEEILDTDTADSLYKRLFEKGATLLLKVLNSYLKDDLKLIAQNHEKATFSKTLTRQDGFVDLLKIENCKLKIARMVRAYFPWPGVWTQLRINDKLLRIKLLPFGKIQVEGKKPMSYKDFLNGYPGAKGILEKLFEAI